MHEQSPYDPRRFVSLCHRDEPWGPAFELKLSDPLTNPHPLSQHIPRELGGIPGEASAEALDYSWHRADAHPKSEPIGSGRGTRSGPPSLVTASSNHTSTGNETRVGLAS